MITKEQYLELVKQNFKDTKYHKKCISDDILFDTSFMEFLERNFIRHDEIINITYSYSCGSGKYYDSWNEETFIKVLYAYVNHVVTCITSKLDFSYINYWNVIHGICAILEKDIKIECTNEEYRCFYMWKMPYGYFGMPYYLGIIKEFGFNDIMPSKDKWFFDKEDIVYDMNNWHKDFPKSKQITFMKDEYDPGWTEDDWTYNEDGTLSDEENSYRNYNRETHEYWDGKTPHKYYDREMYVIRMNTKCNPLRKMNDGCTYARELVMEKGNIIAFAGKNPIYRLKTSLGFSMYYIPGAFSYYVYIDDVSYKKIKLPIHKPTNLKLMDHKRVFIVYNDDTGYWYLPELYYPQKFKNLIKDVLKKNKNIVGSWNSTVVYADSRTLNGKGYSWYNDTQYPDVEDIETFKKVFEKSILKKMKSSAKILSSIGADVKIEMPDKNDWLKPLNIITQEDINKFCNPEQKEELIIEKY